MKKNMEKLYLQLSDLPDEILLIIFKKVNNIALLYSLFNINKRLNRILHDPIFTSHLNFVEFSSNNLVSQLSYQIINRFSFHILPEISEKIKWLNVELSSMGRILLCTNYPNLYGLGLYQMKIETVKQLFNGKIFY
jgi:hypothetical protein